MADWLAGVTAILRGNSGLLGEGVDDRQRKDIMDELGWAFLEYRSRVYASGFSGTTVVKTSAIAALCETALDHIDDTIGRNRRKRRSL